MKRYVLFSALILSLGVALGLAAGTASSQAESKTLVYELRTYTANEGKLDELHARFRDHTMGLFEKHGMTNIGYWVPEGSDDTLIYIVAHTSREQADASWKAFVSDPEWREVYAKSRENGALVAKVERVYMDPTDYSQLK